MMELLADEWIRTDDRQVIGDSNARVLCPIDRAGFTASLHLKSNDREEPEALHGPHSNGSCADLARAQEVATADSQTVFQW